MMDWETTVYSILIEISTYWFSHFGQDFNTQGCEPKTGFVAIKQFFSSTFEFP